MTHRIPDTDEAGSALRRAYTGLVVEVFRLNGDQLAIGNALSADLGLTSARWQVLGAIFLSPVPIPVAHIARNMGLTRQAVQHSVDEMKVDGLVRLEVNPHHRRAMLVMMTERGAAAYHAVSERHGRWAQEVMAGLAPERIEAVSEVLREIQCRLANAAATNPDVFKTEETSHAKIR